MDDFGPPSPGGGGGGGRRFCSCAFPWAAFSANPISMLTIEHLAELLEANRAAAGAVVKEFSVAGRQFQFNSTPSIMGVINLSSDSWYRESVCLTAESAIRRGRVLVARGADIVDVGAESTLSHAARV